MLAVNRKIAVGFAISLSIACLGSLAAGAAARGHLASDQSRWLVPHFIYLTRDQHLNAPLPFLQGQPALQLVLWPVLGALGILLLILINRIRASSPGLSALPEILAGVFLGGALANALEAQVIGSVTDFLGVSGSGTYSAGDIARDIGASLLPIAVIQVGRAQHRTPRSVVLAGMVFYLAVVLVATIEQDYALAVLVTLVMSCSVTFWLIRRAVPRCAATRTTP